MPQMSPMSWIFLSIFLFILFMFLKINFSIKSNFMSKSTTKIKQTIFLW